ncbi:hypothetical protein, partial [Streptomyces lavendulae]|uniref:hypothetical protein n=1 Tax=Streptomyces lavendulae TaxID=1914 RepID=UPI003D7F5EE5
TITFTGAGLNTTAPLNPDGTACITTTTLETGTVTAVYNGDGCLSASTGTAPVTVKQACRDCKRNGVTLIMEDCTCDQREHSHSA